MEDAGEDAEDFKDPDGDGDGDDLAGGHARGPDEDEKAAAEDGMEKLLGGDEDEIVKEEGAAGFSSGRHDKSVEMT